jgi:lipopolysaccharide export system permease protein
MLRSRIILRYLLKENLISFLIILTFSCLLFISIDLIELIRRSSTKSIEFAVLMEMALLHIPSLFPIILPTVFLLSSMNTYMRLNKNNELSVLRASGFSIWSLIFPAIINVSMISIIFLLLFNPIFAYMNIKFKNYESIYFKGNSGLYSISQTGLWLREKNDEFEYVINAKHYSSQEKELRDVKIFKFDLNNKFLERIDVQDVKMINNRLWKLVDGYKLELNKVPEEFDFLSLDINLDAEKIEKNFRPPETISLWELKDYITNLEKAGFSVKKHIVYKNYLYSYPLILISMVLLGCALSLRKERIKKNILKIVFGIIIGVIFHFVSDLIKTLGQTGNLNIFFSVWSLPIVFNLFLISTLIHVEDG